MNTKEKGHVTRLSAYDRKVLDKYTKFYSNFIESNTARTKVMEEKKRPELS